MMAPDLPARLLAAFASDLAEPPAMTLRSGDACDSYGPPLPAEHEIDVVSDEYLTRYASGVAHLDAGSWRHYVPALGELALRHTDSNSMVVSAFIQSLRPPDRDPPRLGSLNSVQEDVLREVLEVLAYSPKSIWQAEACQALEEWWIEPALYRPRR
jgi:hypothetical protein